MFNLVPEKFDYKTNRATPEWLTSVLRENGFLNKGEVTSIVQQPKFGDLVFFKFCFTDLAYMFGLWCDRDFREIVEQPMLKLYLKKLHNQGINYPWEDFQVDYRIFILACLHHPMRMHLYDMPSQMWLPRMERAFDAFEDLDCMGFLR